MSIGSYGLVMNRCKVVGGAASKGGDKETWWPSVVMEVLGWLLDLSPQELNNDSEGDVLFLEKLLKDEPSEAKNSETDSLIRGPLDTFIMGNKEIKFNPLKDIDDPVPIPRVSEKNLDSLHSIFKTFNMTITNSLFDFDYEFTFNSDNPIFDIQNEESDESKMETIMKEVQIHSS
nr:hypothetical protein [Tanacetum cinerariifolium]